LAERLENRDYYDAMARGYERERHHGYHVFLDDSEVRCIADLAHGADVLEVGCGTGLILSRLVTMARSVTGADLSAEMLGLATPRVPSVVQADATRLPFADGTFDLVVSFKVLAHIRDVEDAVSEMARVLRPGGYMALEFYNRRSLRALIKRIKSPSAVAGGVDDTDVFTRYDSVDDARGYLPAGVEPVRTHGIRIAVSAAVLMRLPLVGRMLAGSERVLSRTPLKQFGGFLVVVARKS